MDNITGEVNGRHYTIKGDAGNNDLDFSFNAEKHLSGLNATVKGDGHLDQLLCLLPYRALLIFAGHNPLGAVPNRGGSECPRMAEKHQPGESGPSETCDCSLDLSRVLLLTR